MTIRSVIAAGLATALLAAPAAIARPQSPGGTAARSHPAITLTPRPHVFTTGRRGTLEARVWPNRKGRRVSYALPHYNRKHKLIWVTFGSARTNRHGVAFVHHTFTRSGRYRVRARAARFHGQPVRKVIRTIRVVPPSGTSGVGGGSGTGSGGGSGTGGGGTGTGGTSSGTPDPGFSFGSADLTTAGETHTRHDDMSYRRDCTTQVPTTATPTFAAALTAIDAYTASGTSTQAWKDLALSDPAKPDREDDVAMIALGVHVPAAALAAFVQGYRDHPDQVYFLNGAAAAANSVGHPEWAIALETKAASLNTTGSTGIPDEAIRLTNLSHAHAMMGDWTTAKTLVTQALALAPDAPQINAELAAIDSCAGDSSGASSHYGQSLRTGKPGEDDAVTTGTSGGNAYRTSAPKIWDLSQATSPTIELPALPTSPADLAAQADTWDSTTSMLAKGFWHAEYDRINAQTQSLRAQESTLRAQFNAESMAPVARQQINDILFNLDAGADAQLIGLQARQDDAWYPGGVAMDIVCPEGNDAQFCGGQYADTDCSKNKSAFDLWHADLAAWREDFYAYEGQAEKVFSGMRAQLYDPTAYQLAGVLISEHFLGNALGYVQDLWFKTQVLPTHDSSDNPCWTTPGSDPQPNPAKLDNTDPGPCDPNTLKSHVNLAISAGAGFSIKSTCTTVDIEADASVYKFLGGFTSASFNKDGSGVTAVAGVKASGLGASFVSALYITYDKDGQVTDFGWEVGPSFEPGAGPVSLDAGSDVIKISFMSVFSSPFTL
jgi:hypothetical protein